MAAVGKLLSQGVGWVAFPQHSFWGSIDHINNSLALAEFDFKGSGARLFAWGQGYRYVAHRPPTVVDENGNDVRRRGMLTCRQMKQRGIYRYHYCLVFPAQVSTKVAYYSTPSCEKTAQKGGFNRGISSWHEASFKQIIRPFRLHNLCQGLSWIRPFRGAHPAQVRENDGGHP